MREMVFRIGDRVVAVKDYPEGNRNIRRGMSGTVVHIYGSEPSVGVEWDGVKPGSAFHTCEGRLKERRGWYVRLGDVDFECEEISAPTGDFAALLLS